MISRSANEKPYWTKYRDKRVVYHSNIRAARAGAEGVIELAEWMEVCTRQQNRCLACGVEAPLTLDHVIPFSHGGKNTIANVQALCKPCNSRKSNHTYDFRTGDIDSTIFNNPQTYINHVATNKYVCMERAAEVGKALTSITQQWREELHQPALTENEVLHALIWREALKRGALEPQQRDHWLAVARGETPDSE